MKRGGGSTSYACATDVTSTIDEGIASDLAGWRRIVCLGDFGLVSQLGSVEYSRPRRLRAIVVTEKLIGIVIVEVAGLHS
jgi:hypothetical protein